MEANLCSPASSDMRKTYSGAVTWFDLWVLPETKQTNAEGLVYFFTCNRKIDFKRVKYLLTELLYRSVCAPRQLQCHVDSPSLVLHSTIGLQRDTWAGSFWDDGNVLDEKKKTDVKDIKSQSPVWRFLDQLEGNEITVCWAHTTSHFEGKKLTLWPKSTKLWVWNDRLLTNDSNSTLTFSYLLSIHEPLLLCEIEDFHRDVQLRARFIRDAAIVITDHATFAAGHLKPSWGNRSELRYKQKTLSPL